MEYKLTFRNFLRCDRGARIRVCARDVLGSFAWLSLDATCQNFKPNDHVHTLLWVDTQGCWWISQQLPGTSLYKGASFEEAFGIKKRLEVYKNNHGDTGFSGISKTMKLSFRWRQAQCIITHTKQRLKLAKLITRHYHNVESAGKRDACCSIKKESDFNFLQNTVERNVLQTLKLLFG